MIFLLEPLNGHEEVLKDDSRCDQSIRSGEFCPDTNFEDNPTTLKRSRANLDLCHAWGVVIGTGTVKKYHYMKLQISVQNIIVFQLKIRILGEK